MSEIASCTAGAHGKASAGAPPKTKSLVRKIYELFTPGDRVQILALFCCSLFAALIQAVGVVSIFPFINVVMNPHVIQENRWLSALYRTGSFPDADSFILFLGFVVFAAIIASSLVPALISWAKIRFLFTKQHTLSVRLLTVYLSKPYQYFLDKNSSKLGRIVLSAVGGITSGVLMAIFELLIQSVLLLSLLCFLLLVDVRTTLGAAAILGGGYAALSFLIKKKLKRSGKELMLADAERFRFASEALSGIKTNRVMGIEPYFIANYSRGSFNCIRHNIFSSLSTEMPRYLLEALAFGGIILFLVLKLSAGSPIADMLPLLSLYAFSAYRMMPAMQKLYSAMNQIHYFHAELDKIHADMLEETPETESFAADGGADISIPFAESIRLQSIDFRYPNASSNVIDKLSIVIPKNFSVGFVGSTGSGKTTLVDIILGLLIPRQGRMLVDGTPITEENVRAWRRKIGYVPQEIFLSDDTVRKNVAFGIPESEIDDNQVMIACRIAALEDFIRTLPEQYETRIGERGVRFSGGQRQRIGLARAIYRNPELLVLDEATSSLDGTTEESVLNAIRNASKARTVIMIAHRLNTLKDCDQIYMMEDGRFTACGTYEELLHGNKTFMKMAKVAH